MWADAYSVCPAGVYVAPESRIRKPDDLAKAEIAVGYHSGSHFSTLQALLRFLEPGEINLRFGGILHDRLDMLVDRAVAAAHMFGAPLYVVEQLGFRKVVDASFMMGSLITGDPNAYTGEAEHRDRSMVNAPIGGRDRSEATLVGRSAVELALLSP